MVARQMRKDQGQTHIVRSPLSLWIKNLTQLLRRIAGPAIVAPGAAVRAGPSARATVVAPRARATVIASGASGRAAVRASPGAIGSGAAIGAGAVITGVIARLGCRLGGGLASIRPGASVAGARLVVVATAQGDATQSQRCCNQNCSMFLHKRPRV